MQNNFHQLVDDLVRINKETRHNLKNLVMDITMTQYATEVATVHCNIGRRTGKTSYIISRAKPTDLVIVHNDMVIRSMYPSSINVLTSSSVYSFMDQLRGKRVRIYPSTIYIDEPRLCSSYKPLFEIYSLLAKSPDQTFVLLGE